VVRTRTTSSRDAYAPIGWYQRGRGNGDDRGELASARHSITTYLTLFQYIFAGASQTDQWFSMAHQKPGRPCLINFHQSYLLSAVCNLFSTSTNTPLILADDNFSRDDFLTCGPMPVSQSRRVISPRVTLGGRKSGHSLAVLLKRPPLGVSSGCLCTLSFLPPYA